MDTLQERPNIEVAGTRYTFNGKVTPSAVNNSIWVSRRYADNIMYEETDVEAEIGNTGHAFGSQIVGFGYVGTVNKTAANLTGTTSYIKNANGTNSSNVGAGNSVAWVIRRDTSGVGTLCIFAPNYYNNGGSLAVNTSTPTASGTLQAFTTNSLTFAPWTGKGYAGGTDSEGYGASFERVRVYGGVVASNSLQGMFGACTAMKDCDLTSLQVTTATYTEMFKGCTSLAGVYNSTRQNSGYDNSATRGNYVALQSGMRFQSATSNTAFAWNTSATSLNAIRMFDSCKGMTTVNLNSCFNGTSQNLTYLFTACDGLESVTLTTFGRGSSVNMSYMFYSSFANKPRTGVIPTLTMNTVYDYNSYGAYV